MPSSTRDDNEKESLRRCTPKIARRGDQAMNTLAVVGFYEEWWIQIIKAIVIFAVGLQLVPVRADRRAQDPAASRLAMGPTASAPTVRCSRWRTSWLASS